MNNSKKINDKGFSLIELIVVIAIMVVLVAILSPVFTRFIEQGRRATDVTNANTIASAILIDIESGEFESKSTPKTDPASSPTNIDKDEFPSIGSVPDVQSSDYSSTCQFQYAYNKNNHTVAITLTGHDFDLTDPDVAEDYKNGDEADSSSNGGN